MLVYRYAVPATVVGREAAADDGRGRASRSWRRTRRRGGPGSGWPGPRRPDGQRSVDEAAAVREQALERRGRWISDEAWAVMPTDELEIPEAGIVAIGADGARTRDTTAIAGPGWTTDGACPRRLDGLVDPRGCCARRVGAGGRLDNDLARDFIRDVLLDRFGRSWPLLRRALLRHQANDLAGRRDDVVEMHQGKPEMVEAWDGFYDAVHSGPQPSVLWRAGERAGRWPDHVKAAIGVKTERGWKVSKRPIRRYEPRACTPISRSTRWRPR